MALKYSSLGGTDLPKQFRYAIATPKRSSYVPTKGSGAFFQQAGLISEDQTIQWTCPDASSADKAIIDALHGVSDPYYLFIGSIDQTNHRYQVEFNVYDPPTVNEGGLFDLSGSFRVISKAVGEATIVVSGYLLWSGKTITVTIWNGTANVETTLTEGVDFTAETSDAVTTQNIADAIAALTGASGTTVDVSGTGTTVIVMADAGYSIVNITSNAGEAQADIDLTFSLDWWAYATRGVVTDRMVT